MMAYIISHINLFMYRIVDDRVLFSSVIVTLTLVIILLTIIMTLAYSIGQQNKLESQLKEEALIDLKEYTKSLEKAHNETRRFRHDHLNMLSGLLGYVDTANPGFEEYLKENMLEAKEALKALDQTIDCLQFIHIPELKGLLAGKFAMAGAKGIEFKLDIPKPVKAIPLDLLSLCRIVGIMVDNAIEELLSEGVSSKTLSFGIVIDYDDTLIICANACKTPPPIQEMFTKNYTTKGFNRGLGLHSMSRTCESCGNVAVSAHTENNIFTIVAAIRGKKERVV
jgi:two-component system sensor histidine kinase AgrC